MTITATEQTTETINYEGVEITLVDQNRETIRRFLDGQPSGTRLFRPASPVPMGAIHLGSTSVDSIKSSDLPEGQDKVFFGVAFSESINDDGVGIHNFRPQLFKRLPEDHENHETHFQPLTIQGEPVPSVVPGKFLLASPNLVVGDIYGGVLYGSLSQLQEINSNEAVFVEFYGHNGKLVGRGLNHALTRIPLYFRIPIAEAYTPRIVSMSEREQQEWSAKSDEEKYESLLESFKEMGFSEVEDLGQVICHKFYIVGNHHSGRSKWQIGRFDTDRDFHRRTFIEYATKPEGVPVSETKFKVTYDRRGFELTPDTNGLTVFELPDNWQKITSGVAPVAPGSVSGFTLGVAQNLLNGFSTRMDSMNEALNEYAEEAGHCSEFEDSVIPLGFSGRESYNTVTWDVDVEVDFTYTDSELGSRDTSYMESIVGIDNLWTGGEVTFTGTTTISLSIEGPRDADSQYFNDRISTEDIEVKLSGDIEISDWRVEDWNDNN